MRAELFGVRRQFSPSGSISLLQIGLEQRSGIAIPSR